MTLIIELLIGAFVFSGILLSTKSGRNIFKALKNRVANAADEAEKELRDPVADGKAAIAEAKDKLSRLKESRRKLMTSISLLDKKIANATATRDKFETVAKAAAQAGDATAARVAIGQKQAAEKQLTMLTAAQKANNTTLEAFNNGIRDLTAKITEAEANSESLVIRAELAKVRAEISLEELNDTGTAAALDRLREDTEEVEAEVGALEAEQAERTDSEKVLEKYGDHSTNSIDEELEQLMASSSSFENRGIKLNGDEPAQPA